MKFSVTQFGKELDESKYTWDEKTRIFSSDENDLVLDFTGISWVTFKTGFSCTFKTGHGCIFKTGFSCTFKTGTECVVIRRDVYEVIKLKENQKIQLNDYREKGYNIIK